LTRLARLGLKKACETLIDFLARELPPTRRDDAEHFAKAIREAGERYNRYDERRADWEKYSRRRARLHKLKALSGDLSLRTAIPGLDHPSNRLRIR
jgi:hypothetical protein